MVLKETVKNYDLIIESTHISTSLSINTQHQKKTSDLPKNGLRFNLQQLRQVQESSKSTSPFCPVSARSNGLAILPRSLEWAIPGYILHGATYLRGCAMGCDRAVIPARTILRAGILQGLDGWNWYPDRWIFPQVGYLMRCMQTGLSCSRRKAEMKHDDKPHQRLLFQKVTQGNTAVSK